MGPRNSQYPLTMKGLLGKPLRPGLDPVATVQNRFHERIAAGHHIAHHPQIGSKPDLLCVVAFDQVDAKRDELIAHRRVDVGVAAGDTMASVLRERGDAAHESAADAEDVNVHCAIIRMQDLGLRPTYYPRYRYHGEPLMGRKTARQNGMRARIAAAAARIMAENGIDDFALAKRKAARALGASDTEALPANGEIEAELRAYRALYQAEEHPERIAELRRVALDAMRALERFNPYLTGPVLSGIAGPYAEVDLQLFPESTKEVELFLLERNITYAAGSARRYAGDRAHAVAVLSLKWLGAPLRLSVFDPRDERLALKTSQAGRVMARAGIAEVGALLQSAHGPQPA